MFPLPSQGWFEGYSNPSYGGIKLHPEPRPVNVMEEGDLIPRLGSSSPKAGKVPTEAAKSHKEAERKRRQRINSHLSTLRSLLPGTVQADKASLLGEVVRHVRELREKVGKVAFQFPGEADEATLTYYWGGGCGGGVDSEARRRMIRVSVCCEDRPGLNKDLGRAIGLVPVEAVQAEVTTVGGRTRSSLVLRWRGGTSGRDRDEEEDDVRVLKRALRDVVENRVADWDLERAGHVSKRAREG